MAAEFMRSGEEYSEREIERFYCYPDGKPHNLKEHRVEWEESEYLPAGWKCRESTKNTIDVMARGGERFTSYKKAVEFMKASESYTDEDIERFYCYPDGKTHDLVAKRIEEAKRNEERRKEMEANRGRSLRAAETKRRNEFKIRRVEEAKKGAIKRQEAEARRVEEANREAIKRREADARRLDPTCQEFWQKIHPSSVPVRYGHRGARIQEKRVQEVQEGLR